MSNKPEEKDFFIESACAGEVIRLSEWWDQVDGKDESKGYFWTLCLSFYNNMFSGETTWRYRFRHIWHIIKKGTPWSDEIVLELKQTKILRDKLTEIIKQAEKLAPANKGE